MDRVNWLCRVKTGDLETNWITREPAKKETTNVKRRKKTTTPKEPEAKQGDYQVGTDENVLVLNRTYANRANASAPPKCSGNVCSAGLRHSPCSWQRGGQISTQKCP